MRLVSDERLLALVGACRSAEDLVALGIRESDAESLREHIAKKGTPRDRSALLEVPGFSEETLVLLSKCAALWQLRAWRDIDKEMLDAWQAYTDGHYELCGECCTRARTAAAASGEEAEILHAEGLAKFYKHELDECLADLRRSEEVAHRRGLYVRATVFRLDTASVWAYFGHRSHALGDLEDCEALLEKLWCLTELPQQLDMEQAEWWLHFQIWKARHSQAGILDNMLRFSDAVARYQKAWEVGEALAVRDRAFTLHRNSKNNLAISLFYCGRIEECKQAFEELRNKDPKNLTYANNAGFLYMILGDLERARSVLEEGLAQGRTQNENTAHVDYNLSLVYKRLADSCPLPDRKQGLDTAMSHAREAYGGFIKQADLLRALTADYRATHLEKRLRRLAGYDPPIPPLDAEQVMTQEVLLELLGDVDNFVTDGAKLFDAFGDFLRRDRTLGQEVELRVLRRWNSYTPGVPVVTESGRRGGGYFLAWQGKGVVVDPGFQFMSNLTQSGLSLADINAILVSHAHIDHTAELEDLVALLAERRQEVPSASPVALGLSIGTLNKHNIGWLLRETDIVNPIYVLTPRTPVRLFEDLEVQVLEAQHEDIVSERTAVGFRFKDPDTNFCITLSSDTAYSEGIAAQYEASDVLVLHLGTATFAALASRAGYQLSDEAAADLVDKGEWLLRLETVRRAIEKVLGYGSVARFKDYLTRRLSEQDLAKLDSDQHLLFHGVYSVLRGLQVFPKIVVLSEFGEELGANRYKVAKVLNRHLAGGTFGLAARDTRCLTGDVDLRIRLIRGAPEVRCDLCRRFVPVQQISETCRRSADLSILHVCSDCLAKGTFPA